MTIEDGIVRVEGLQSDAWLEPGALDQDPVQAGKEGCTLPDSMRETMDCGTPAP